MNDLLSDLLDRNTKAVTSENEYIGEDGLFYALNEKGENHHAEN